MSSCEKIKSSEPKMYEMAEMLVMLKEHNPWTFYHSLRVAELSNLFAKSLSYPNFDLAHLETGARFHDIGKLSVPIKILNKNQGLTPNEWEKIKLHPEQGLFWVAQLNQLIDPSSVEIILNHHEKLDGSGYPKGIQHISLSTRIVTIVDVFDALSNDRPYHPALSVEDSLKVIEGSDVAKGQLDKELFHSFESFIARQSLDDIQMRKTG